MRLRLTLLLAGSLLLPFAGSAQVEPRDEFVIAEVADIVDERVEEDMDMGTRTLQTVRMRLVSGPDAGDTFLLENGILGTRRDMRLVEGEKVVVEKLTRTDGSIRYLVKEKYRLPALGWLFAGFFLLALLLGGRTSAMSVIGLLVSVGILLKFTVPRIVGGENPLFISILSCGIIACTSLYLAHGFSRRTSVALLSTVLTLCASSVLAVVFVRFARLFGMGSEESVFLQLGALQNVDLQGLLLGGMLIGCLGVLDDITTAQTAAVHEISKANPSLSPAALRRAGYSVGKEHIASLINTLALAYVGASLPLFLLFETQADFPLWVTVNSEFLAEEIVRTLVGSATLLIAVPLSTWLASSLLRAAPGSRPERDGFGHHHHHHHA